MIDFFLQIGSNSFVTFAKMSFGGLTASFINGPDELTQLEGNSFAINGKLLILGGYRLNDLWTPNYTGTNFFETEPMKTFAYMVSMHDKKHDSMTVDIDFSRLIGASLASSSNKNCTLTYGGLCQKVIADQRKLSPKVSDNLIIHNWSSNGELVEFIKDKPVLVGSVEEAIIRGVEFVDIEEQSPPPRIFHASVWDDKRKYLWVFGGGILIGGNVEKHDDLWFWNSNKHTWRQAKVDPPKSNYIFSNLIYRDDVLYTVSENAILMLDISNIGDLHWKRVPIPDELRHPMNGAKVILKKSPLLNDHLIIIGGTDLNLYDDISNFKRINEAKDFGAVPSLWILSYSLDSGKFFRYDFASNVPYISYHSVAYDQDFLYLIGGLSTKDEMVKFNTKIISIRWWDMFSKECSLLKFPFAAPDYHYEISNLSVNSILDSIREVTETLFFKKRLDEYKSIKIPFPLNNYVVVDNMACEKKVIQSRIKGWSHEFTTLPKHYINDIFVYAYTDWIEYDCSRPLDFDEFVRFMELLREFGVYRLMWFEFAMQVNKMSFTQLVRFLTRQGNSSSIADDPNFALGQVVLNQVINEVPESCCTIAIMSNLMKLHNFSDLYKAKKEHNAFETKLNEPLELPVSTYYADLCFSGKETKPIRCKDCVFYMNPYEIEIVDFSDVEFQLIHALYTHNVSKIKKFDDLTKVLNLLDKATNVNDELVNNVLGNAKMAILMLFMQCPENQAATILSHTPPVTRFIIETIGMQRQSIIQNEDGDCLGISHLCLLKDLPRKIYVSCSKEMMFNVAILLYSGFSISVSERFMTRKEEAEAALNIFANNDSFKEKINKSVVRFILQNLIFENRVFNVDGFCRFFSLLYKLGFLEKIVSMAPNDDWINQVITKYSDNLPFDQLSWLMTKLREKDANQETAKAPQIIEEEDIEETETDDFYWVNA